MPEFAHHTGPIARRFLTEQACAGIPGRVVAIQQPAPIRRKLEQYPHRLAERASQMRGGCVHADEEVQICDQRRRVRKIFKQFAPVRDADFGEPLAIAVAQLLLQADEVGIEVEQRPQQLQGDGAARWISAAGPYEANPRPSRGPQALRPSGLVLRVGL